MSNYLRNRPFMVVTFTFVPKPGQNTSMKNFGELGQFDAIENMVIVDRVSSKNLTDSWLILDLFEQQVVKAREVPAEDHQRVFDAYVTKYQQEVKGALARWITQDPTNLQKVKDYVAKVEAGIPVLEAIRNNIEEIVRDFVFDENTPAIRQELSQTISTYLLLRAEAGDLVDYTILCDDSNNAEERVMAGELWADISIQLEEGGEFVYIPVRVITAAEPQA